MIPSSVRLVRAIRRLISEIGVSAASAEVTAKVAMIDAMLNDFALANETGFYEAHITQGRALVTEALLLMEERNLSTSKASRAASIVKSVPVGAGADTSSHALVEISDVLIESLEAFFAESSPRVQESRSDFFRRVSAWERQLYKERAEYQRTAPANVRLSLRAEQMRDYLRAKFPAQADVEVTSCTKLSGGYSRSTWLIETRGPAGECNEFVIRGEQPGSPTTVSGFNITTEFGIIQIAHRAGIPVPEPLWVEPDAAKLGMRFIAVRRSKGKNCGSFAGPTRDISPELLKHLVKVLLDIHRVDLSQYSSLVNTTHLVEWVGYKTIQEATRFWVEKWRSSWRSGPADSPILARVFSWLLHNVPECDEPPALLHSDYSLGNILVDNEEVSAVLDWEVTHVGDPAEEISWLIGNLKGFVDRDTIIRLYRELGGRAIDEYRLRYFEVFAATKTMVAGIVSIRQFEREDVANPNLHWLNVLIMPSAADTIESLIEHAERAR